MKSKVLLTAACVLLLSVTGIAQGKDPQGSQPGTQGAVQPNNSTNCTKPSQPLPDGMTASDYASAGYTYYYGMYALAGHSYSAEVWDPSDADPGIFPAALGLFNGDCTQSPTSKVVSDVDPKLFWSFSGRISWIAPTSDYYQVWLKNTSAIKSFSYSIRITDTTLHNPRWTTWSGFITQYSFVNTTDSSITGTLTVTDGLSGTQYPVDLVIPARHQVIAVMSGTGTGSPGLNLPPNRAGFADFAFIGPPGAIIADAYYLNSSATVVVPSSFGPRNYQH